jgi:cytochrome c peroxidase
MESILYEIPVLLLLVMAIVFFLIKLVRELGVSLQKKWLLFLGLGSGVLAFTIKLALIIGFSSFPDELMALLPEKSIKLEPLITVERKTLPGQGTFKQTSYRWQALPTVAPSPEDNPQTPAKIALGKKLFFDKRLSLDNTVSCASCHELSTEKGGTDGLPVSIGIDQQQGSRNAPTVLNAAFQRVLFWDGRAASLEEQAKGPIINPIEMGMPSHALLVERLDNFSEYKDAFSKAFPEQPEININNIAKAIASFERILITPDTPYDRFIQGDSTALSSSQLRGMALFESIGCVQCHSGANFSGAAIGEQTSAFRIFPAVSIEHYETRYRLSDDHGLVQNKANADKGVWRIPSLRNVTLTAPYFHNGSVESLEEAVRIMAAVQLNMALSDTEQDDQAIYWSDAEKKFTVARGRALSESEVKDIVAFLHALEGKLPESGGL